MHRSPAPFDSIYGLVALWQCKAQVHATKLRTHCTTLHCTLLCLTGLFVMFVMFIMSVMALAWQWPQRLFYLRLHGVEGERRIIQRLSVNCIHNPLSSQATAVCSWWVSADRRAAARAPASPCKYDIHFWQELIPSSLQCDQNNIYNSIPTFGDIQSTFFSCIWSILHPCVVKRAEGF